jgi:dihydrodipicolinate synthase/N-acetylneuraminate lyase
MSQQLRGIFSIAYTPFDEEGELLWADFDTLITKIGD